MTLTHTGSVSCVTQLSDGQICSVSHNNKTIKILDVGTDYIEENGARAMTLTGHTKDVSCVTQLSDGWICSGSGDETIKIWDVGTGRV